MAMFEITPQDRLFYEQTAPQILGAPTFVFVNALTGNLLAWESRVAPALREKGFGALSFNFRGQEGSTFAPGGTLDEGLLLDDLRRLLADRAPRRPILVGLSVGGLLAAKACLAGSSAAGLVLINTLREKSPRLDWIAEAMPRLMARGGASLYLDALLPMLVNPEFLQEARAFYLKGGYEPLEPEQGHASLVREAVETDWSLDYEKLDLPVLVITGLHDRVFLDRGVVNKLFARLPNAEAEAWDDAGHLPPQERPERLVDSLERFASRISVDTR